MATRWRPARSWWTTSKLLKEISCTSSKPIELCFVCSIIRINNQSGIVTMAVVRFERAWLLNTGPSLVKCNLSLGLDGFQVKTTLLATNEMQLTIHKATKYSQDKTGSKITKVEGPLEDLVPEISKDFYHLTPIHWFENFCQNFLMRVVIW